MVQSRKIYTSFHDIPPRDYMYFPKGTLEVGKPGKFSRIEINHLLISMAVLTIAFSLLITRNNFIYGLIYGFNLSILPYGIALSFLSIAIAFFFHEISHKLMAQKHGLWAEYRMYPNGLRLALILGIFTPFIFAAPGAVMFRGGSRNFETGQIAVAGPLANVIIALITFPVYIFLLYEESILGHIFGFICLINAFLATFNLLPFGPLDGMKVIRWNATVWIILFMISITLLTIIFTRATISL